MQKRWVVKSVEAFWRIFKAERGRLGGKLEARYHLRDGARMTVYQGLKLLREHGFQASWSSPASVLEALRERARELRLGKTRLAALMELPEETLRKILRGKRCPSFARACLLAKILDEQAPNLEPISLVVELAPPQRASVDDAAVGAADRGAAVSSRDDAGKGPAAAPMGGQAQGAPDQVDSREPEQPSTPQPAQHPLARPGAAGIDGGPDQQQRSGEGADPGEQGANPGDMGANPGGERPKEGQPPPARGAKMKRAKTSRGAKSTVDSSQGAQADPRGARSRANGGQDDNIRTWPLVIRKRAPQACRAMHVVKCRFPDGRTTVHEEPSIREIRHFLLRAVPGDALMDVEILVDNRPFDATSLLLQQQIVELKAEVAAKRAPPATTVGLWDVVQCALETYEEHKKEQRKEKRRHGRK